MDEDETTITYTLIPRKHDKWSVLVLASNWVAEVAEVTAQTLASASLMLAQHSVQTNIDHEFAELMEKNDG